MFKLENKKGEVLGNKVEAMPIPYGEAMEVLQASRSGDDTTTVDAMAKVVTKYVIDDEGNAINAKELPADVIAKLYLFATSTEYSVSDFIEKP